MASGSVRLQRCIVLPAGRHSASLIFLHGSGGLQFYISVSFTLGNARFHSPRFAPVERCRALNLEGSDGGCPLTGSGAVHTLPGRPSCLPLFCLSGPPASLLAHVPLLQPSPLHCAQCNPYYPQPSLLNLHKANAALLLPPVKPLLFSLPEMLLPSAFHFTASHSIESIQLTELNSGLILQTQPDYKINARNWVGPYFDFRLEHLHETPLKDRPYTPMKGGLSNVWFDRFKISNDCPEHLESIDVMCQVLADLIDDEVKSGIKKNRILLGGFSMGGCMAMHLAYRNHRDVAGVFALSSFLNKTSAVYQALQKTNGVLPELFQCHGTADELVLYSWAEETNSMLRSLGVSTQFHSFPGVYHELSKTELEKLKSWVVSKLPGDTERQNE
ncbi:lysophospholipase-like protein 1 [Orycteropus afer afer]|uniref:palmitoyl-protein hydrolase n=1 Tax=Orycteropus afer afer TaxID=1230840 RepID=A0A8B6ZHL0_ORYAF|nr:lysophospholipase-like protein 1 [Orycteropus afer afer]